MNMAEYHADVADAGTEGLVRAQVAYPWRGTGAFTATAAGLSLAGGGIGTGAEPS